MRDDSLASVIRTIGKSISAQCCKQCLQGYYLQNNRMTAYHTPLALHLIGKIEVGWNTSAQHPGDKDTIQGYCEAS